MALCILGAPTGTSVQTVAADASGVTDQTRSLIAAIQAVQGQGKQGSPILPCGDILIGSIQVANVTVSGSTLTVSSGGFPGVVVGDNVSVCDSALNIGSSCPVVVQSSPSGTVPGQFSIYSPYANLSSFLYEGDTITLSGAANAGLNKNFKVETVNAAPVVPTATTATLTAGTAYTAIPVAAIQFAVAVGDSINVAGTVFTASGTAAPGAPSIPVTSLTPSTTLPSGSTVTDTTALGSVITVLIDPSDTAAFGTDTVAVTAIVQLLPPGTTVQSISANTATVAITAGMAAIPTYPTTAIGTLTVDLPVFTAGQGMESSAAGNVQDSAGSLTAVAGTNLIYVGQGRAVTVRPTAAQWTAVNVSGDKADPVMGRFAGINIVGSGTTLTRFGVTVAAARPGAVGWDIGDGQYGEGVQLRAQGFSSPGCKGVSFCNWHHWTEKGDWKFFLHDCDDHIAWRARGTGAASFDGIKVFAVCEAPGPNQRMFAAYNGIAFGHPDLRLIASGAVGVADGSANYGSFLHLGQSVSLQDGKLNTYAELSGQRGSGGAGYGPTTIHASAGVTFGPMIGSIKFNYAAGAVPWRGLSWPTTASGIVVFDGPITGEPALTAASQTFTGVSIDGSGNLTFPTPAGGSNSVTLTSTANSVTATFGSAHGIPAGATVAFQGCTASAYNNTPFQVAAVTSTTVTINTTLNPGADSGTCWQVFPQKIANTSLINPFTVTDNAAVVNAGSWVASVSRSLNAQSLSSGYAKVTLNQAPTGAATGDTIVFAGWDGAAANRTTGPKVGLVHAVTGSTKTVQSISFAFSDVVTHTLTANSIFQFTGTSSGPRRLLLFLTNGGSHTVTWPNLAGAQQVIWQGGSAPTLQTSGTDLIEFVSVDGVTLYGRCLTATINFTSPTTDLSFAGFQLTGLAGIKSAVESGGSAPTVAVNANAGTGATAAVVGNDLAGQITITAGSASLAGGTQATLTFAAVKAGTAIVLLTSADTHRTIAGAVMTSSGGNATGFNLGAGALTAANVYTWNYLVIQ